MAGRQADLSFEDEILPDNPQPQPSQSNEQVMDIGEPQPVPQPQQPTQTPVSDVLHQPNTVDGSFDNSNFVPVPSEPIQEPAQAPQQPIPQQADSQSMDALMLEVDRASQMLKEVEPYAPILNRMQYDPNFAKQINEMMTPEQAQPEAQLPEFNVDFNDSVLPKPPENFDPLDQHDPSTPSGKYMQDYMRAIGKQAAMQSANYAKQVADARTKALEDQIQAQRQEQMERLAYEQQVNQFKSTHNDVNDQQLNEFMQFINNPNGITMDHLWDVYRAKNGMLTNPQPNNQQLPPQAPAPQQRAGMVEQIRRANNMPVPSANINANNNLPPATPEESFGADLLNFSNSNWY